MALSLLSWSMQVLVMTFCPGSHSGNVFCQLDLTLSLQWDTLFFPSCSKFLCTATLHWWVLCSALEVDSFWWWMKGSCRVLKSNLRALWMKSASHMKKLALSVVIVSLKSWIWKGHLYFSKANTQQRAKRELKQPKKMLSHVILGSAIPGSINNYFIVFTDLSTRAERERVGREKLHCSAAPSSPMASALAPYLLRGDSTRAETTSRWMRKRHRWRFGLAHLIMIQKGPSFPVTLWHSDRICCLSHSVLLPFPLSRCQHAKTPWQGQYQSATF